jgi:hypothetical protein
VAFTTNLSTARAYYGPSLSDPRDQPEYWTNYPQKLTRPIGGQFTNFAMFLAGVGGVAAAGYLPFGKGRVWDKYVAGLRAFEEYSPGRIFRTFQLSATFSPFETAVRQADLFVSPTLLRSNKQYTQYLSRLIGRGSYGRVLQEGVTLRAGSLFWGRGPEIALPYASAIRTAGLGESSNIGAAYARSMGMRELRGVPPFERFFAAAQPFKSKYPDITNPLIGGYPAQIIGGRNVFQHQYRKLAALGTEQISRFNRLLGYIPGIGKHLATRPGGGLGMLGRLTAKFGLGLGALSLGYETLDWYARQSELFEGTLFSEGITYGLASIPVAARVRAAEISESLGLSEYARRQEEMAPGSTSLLKLAAFPVMGAFGVGALSYGAKVAKMAQLQMAEGISSSMARHRMEEAFKTWGRFGTFAENIGASLEARAARGGLLGKIAGRMTPTRFGMLLGAGAGLAAILPFLPGALFPQQTSEELRDIYSGKQEVPIRKGRYWEFGRSAYEGGRIMYYRPHAYALIGSRAREKAIWGEEYETLNPIERWYKENFTYELERKHYEARPYPITGAAFEDVPFLGPLISATVGRWIKPVLPMHQEQWISEKGIRTEPPGFGARVATEIGQTAEGMPISPYSPTQVAGEQMYRVGTEMIGLTGFITASIKEKITGSQDWFDQMAQLESAARITSYEREYWEQELGGLAGFSEAWRRLYPHRRRQIDLKNPIRNLMPEWIPGPGEKGPNLLFGDPYARVSHGETRLPGPGLEALYPELAGVPYEEYGPSWRMKILGDVAPYAQKYRQAVIQARSARNRKENWTEEDEARFQTTLSQVKRKKQRVEFQEYKYLSSMGEIFPSAKQESSELMIAMNEWKASQQEKPSLFQKFFGGYWELLAHNAETAWGQLTPVSPAAKLVHIRSPIESYEREVLYGQAAAFWQHPVSHFLAPFARSMGHAFGYEGVPEASEHTRNLEEYFDVLKYVKNARLSNLARIAGDTAAVKEFENNKNETLFGINPFTRNYGNLLRALPRRERDYLATFENAGSMEERQRILEMVPENEKALYVARWKLVHADELKKAIKADILTEGQEAEADRQIDRVYREAKSEGFPTSEELMAEYLQTKGPGESYADWYRRVKILGNVQNIPGPDWVGWHPSVDLEDVKFKLVQHLGEEPIPLNLWPSRAKELPYKPYINEETIDPIINEESLTSEEMKSRINELLFADKMKGDVFITTTAATRQDEVELSLHIEEDRTEEEEELLREVLNA